MLKENKYEVLQSKINSLFWVWPQKMTRRSNAAINSTEYLNFLSTKILRRWNTEGRKKYFTSKLMQTRMPLAGLWCWWLWGKKHGSSFRSKS